MKKNDILEVDIIDNGMNFEGIAKFDNFVIFIPNVIKGERVKVKILKVNKHFAFAKIIEILNKSEYRIESICDNFLSCGSCNSMHMNYEYELLLKKNNVENLFNKMNIKGVEIQLPITLDNNNFLNYRNKIAYPVRCVNGVNKIGFYSMKSHNIILNDICYIQNDIIDKLAKDIFNYLNDNNFSMYNEENNEGNIKHIILRRGERTGEILVVIVTSNIKLKDNDIIKNIKNLNKNIKSIFINYNNLNNNEIIINNSSYLVYGEKYIKDRIGNYFYYISPESFFQVNTLVAEKLYFNLKEKLNLKGDEILFDLYSGVGSIGIFLSSNVKKVYGIEIVKEAVDMANLNISLNNVNNCEYIAGSVEDKIIEFKERKIKPDVIVVDPPRKGLDDKSIEYILEFAPLKIGYVSCNPATLVRDIKKLESNYNIVSCTLCDLFPRTYHVETICILYKKN